GGTRIGDGSLRSMGRHTDALIGQIGDHRPAQAGVNQCLSLTTLKLVRQVEHWALLAYRGVKSRAGHHRLPARFFFAVCRGAALYRLPPLTTTDREPLNSLTVK